MTPSPDRTGHRMIRLPRARWPRIPTWARVLAAVVGLPLALIGLIAVTGVVIPTWELRREFDHLALEEVVTRQLPDPHERAWATTLDPTESSEYLERSYTFDGDSRDLVAIVEQHLRSRGYRIEYSEWSGADVTDDAINLWEDRDADSVRHEGHAVAPGCDLTFSVPYAADGGTTSMIVRVSPPYGG